VAVSLTDVARRLREVNHTPFPATPGDVAALSVREASARRYRSMTSSRCHPLFAPWMDQRSAAAT
jgi:hypothetical protein